MYTYIYISQMVTLARAPTVMHAVRVCVCIYIHEWEYKHMYICIYVYIHIHITDGDISTGAYRDASSGFCFVSAVLYEVRKYACTS